MLKHLIEMVTESRVISVARVTQRRVVARLKMLLVLSWMYSIDLALARVEDSPITVYPLLSVEVLFAADEGCCCKIVVGVKKHAAVAVLHAVCD